MGTLRMPDQPTAPAIAPASWFPPPIDTLSELNASTTVENTVSDSSRESDLGDLATEDGVYGSGSESCGSNSFPNDFMCAIINAGDTSAHRGNGGNTGNGTDPPIAATVVTPATAPIHPTLATVATVATAVTVATEEQSNLLA